MSILKRKHSSTTHDEPSRRRPKLATRDLDNDYYSGKEGLKRDNDFIGSGTTAVVRLMHKRGDPKAKIYAVKQFYPTDPDEEWATKRAIEQIIYTEFYIAQRLNHPNIVSSSQIRKVPDSLAIVMEYCGAGDLLELTEPGGNPQFTDRACIFKQMLRGVGHMHSEGVAHRGIRPEKLLITKYGNLKICDFGTATVFHDMHRPTFNQSSTPGESIAIKLSLQNDIIPTSYSSPEAFARNQKYDPRAADVWSLGVTALMLFMRRSPWDEPNAKKDDRFATFMRGWDMFLDSEGYRPITDTVFPDCGLFFEQMPEPGLRTLLLRMLHPMPERRITVHEALNHPWVRQIECCSLEAWGMRRPELRHHHDHIPPRVKRIIEMWKKSEGQKQVAPEEPRV